MPLPTMLQQSAITNEREALGILREQRDIMKKLSDSIVSNQRDSGSLKKDMVDLKKEFVLGMKSISEIPKYFAEMKSDRLKERRVDTKENTNTNIFSALISKLVGKRDSVANKDFVEIQTRLLEETRIIKALALDNMDNIRFIKKSYEDKERAKERKLLAEAIADAIGSDNKGGFLKGIVGPLLAGFGVALATLGSALISGIGTAISAALTTIGAMMAKNALTPDIDIDRRRGSTTVGAPVPGGPDLDADKKTKPKPTFRERVNAGAGFLGRIALPALAIGGLASLLSAEETQYGTGANENATTPEEVGGNPAEMGLPQAMAKVEAEKKLKAAEEERLKKLSAMSDQTDAETMRLQRQADTAKEMEKITEASMAGVKEKAEQTKDATQDIFGMMSAKMKDFISTLGGDTDMIGKSAVDILNNIGNIDFGEGKQVNLLPGLGSKAADMIENLQDSLSSAKDVVAGGGSTQLNTVNNTTFGGSTMTLPADSSSIDTDPGILRYLKR